MNFNRTVERRKKLNRGVDYFGNCAGQVGRWLLNECEGTVTADPGGNGSDGALVGTPCGLQVSLEGQVPMRVYPS